MRTWFTGPAKSFVTNGQYERWDLVLDAGDDQSQFLNEFGHRVIQMYLAPFKSFTLLAIREFKFDLAKQRSRLFDKSGNATQTFESFAGEVLAVWAEESYTLNTIVRSPRPHDATPAFDAIALENDGDSWYVRFLQVKTTQTYAGDNANEAARALGGLDDSNYDIELMAILEDVAARQPDESKKRAIIKGLIPAMRRYRVVVLHEGPAPPVVLTNFDQHIRGDLSRRSAAFLQLPNWQVAWIEISRAGYADTFK